MTNHKNSASKRGPAKINHRFLNVREVILNPTPGTGLTQTPMPVTSNAGGAGNGATVLTSMGLTSVVLTSGNFSVPSTGVYNVLRPALRGMYNRASDFQWYRVTRAKLIFVGNVGSTATGTITLAAYTDPSDVELNTNAPFISGANTRVFDIANAANKELSVPVPVDSSWKKVTSVLASPGNAYPYAAADATSFVPVNTVCDLSFGAVQWTCANAGASVSLGNLYLEYDVEYKAPIDASVNL